ncbi:peroxiredoxin [Aquimarina sp. 2201CG5-10]|uniref:peroxiredoxin n=1 Tax=Aquimarina callyspongiae TaxID=3098150 RepID=UPI002AB3F3F4|nr:peroxiredoxin [Aquimarina sp. 2201CG5-10]MDY8137902.1 peroxiredoxin [Aquimarina sp. 2201CG5-10]
MTLRVGDRVPEFKTKNDQDEIFESSSLIGYTPVVIYFYPKNFTPGCIKEACDFRDRYQDFKELGAEIIGISSDSIKSHEKFKRKYRLPFTFLTDQEGKLRKLFGVKAGLLGLLPGRETFVVDKRGIVRLRFNSIQASKHTDKALSKVKEIVQE